MAFSWVPPALRHRQYRLLWLGMLISTAGSYMQSAAVLWHISELSDQPIALGGVGLVQILPILGFSLLAGSTADSINRRRVMFVTQSAAALLAGLLGWLTFVGVDSVGVIYAVLAVAAAISAFDLPARQALIPNTVPPDDLPNAFSLNSIAFNFGAVSGPALGGLVIAHYGVAAAYFVNAISFGAILIGLLLMGPVPQTLATTIQGKGFLSGVQDGVRFVSRHPIILSSMLLDFFATFFSSATALLPIFAKQILNVGAVGYGWLTAASALGSGLAALLFVFRSKIRRQGSTLLLSVAGFGIATIIFGLSRAYWLTFLALAISGLTDGISTIIRNTIRQLATPDNMRGRMTSINQIFFRGGPLLGELEAGAAAQWFGAPWAVISGGIGCLLALLWTHRRFPELRRFEGDEAPDPA